MRTFAAAITPGELNMKIIVLQHLDVEHPGIFRTFLRDDGHAWDTVEVDAGDTIPDLTPYDLMIVMGGPQDVWQEDQYPWLVAEKAAIRRFVVDMKRPYLGICLGHQLLACAVGGEVGPGTSPEVGVNDVIKTTAGKADPLLAGVGDVEPVLQWHGAEVKSLPAATEVLATSPACAVQAFRYGNHAWGLQYHVEATSSTVDDWADIPEYAKALETSLGAGAVDGLRQAVAREMPRFNAHARKIYDNLNKVMATV
jgi:GMP synthase-like glutamine amidotransferase